MLTKYRNQAVVRQPLRQPQQLRPLPRKLPSSTAACPWEVVVSMSAVVCHSVFVMDRISIFYSM